MRKFIHRILTAALLGTTLPVWVSCSEEGDTENAFTDALPLQGITASIGTVTGAHSRAPQATRANTTTAKEPLYIGREAFVGGEKIKMTKFCRTANSISTFSYTDIDWEKLSDESGWTRVEDSNGKVYWSDAQNPHTFVGYSLPYDTFSWVKSEGENSGVDVYRGQLTLTDGAIDYTNYTGSDGTEVSGNEKMKKDDIVLSYSTEVVPDATGIATIDFRHGLACLTVDLNIRDYSSTSGVGENEKDNATRVISLTIPNQPYKYKWTQGSDAVQLDDEEATADVKAWTNSVEGDLTTTGRDRRFYYHALAVPGTRSQMDIEFTVTYPDPMNTSRTLTKNYKATATGVELVGGKRTVIKITLNHQNEDMTVGTEYIDWQFWETPDEGELTKNSTYLSSTDQSNVKLHGDESIYLAEDAVWLYTDKTSVGNKVLDIYGNDGTADKPYSIATANQLLAFAYEVNNGMDFAGKHVQLNANLYMQPTTSASGVSWIGIGTADHPFKGHFEGGLHNISRMKGSSLFGYVGEGAIVEGISLVNMLGTTNGGSVAYSNAGTIIGCAVNGDVTGTDLAGGICAANSGTVTVCSHIGAVKADATTGVAGGIAANNSGTVNGKACYVASGMTGGTVYMQCHYDTEFYTSATEEEASTWGKNSSEMMKASFVTGLNDNRPEGTVYKFQFSPSEYPALVVEK